MYGYVNGVLRRKNIDIIGKIAHKIVAAASIKRMIAVTSSAKGR